MGNNDAGETSDAFYQQREIGKSWFPLGLILELKTETERTAQDQWGLGLQLVQDSIMCSTACGHLKASNRKAVTTVWPKRWPAQSEEFRFPTGNGGISLEQRGHSQRRRAGWR